MAAPAAPPQLISMLLLLFLNCRHPCPEGALCTCACMYLSYMCLCGYRFTPWWTIIRVLMKNQTCSYANTWAQLNWHMHACISCTYTCFPLVISECCAWIQHCIHLFILWPLWRLTHDYPSNSLCIMSWAVASLPPLLLCCIHFQCMPKNAVDRKMATKQPLKCRKLGWASYWIKTVIRNIETGKRQRWQKGRNRNAGGEHRNIMRGRKMEAR